MKKVCIPMLVFLLMLCLIPLCEATEDTDQILSVLNENGVSGSPAQLQVWGNTAACFAKKNGQKALCVLEKQGTEWVLTVCNEKALRQDRDWPDLQLDSDSAIFWKYLLDDRTAIYHAKKKNGIWGRVDETTLMPRGENSWCYSVFWAEGNGGEIIRSALMQDENEALITHDISMEFFPASWIRTDLTDFDLSRFPSMGISGDYGDEWPGQAFKEDAARALMPDYTYVNGVYDNGSLHFLMDKPNGTRVYVVCLYGTGFTRSVHLVESTPLSTDTPLGVENFSNSLGLRAGLVSMQAFQDPGQCGIREIYMEQGGFLHMGRQCLISPMDKNILWYGVHPWADMTRMDWSSIPSSEQEILDALTRMDSSGYAVVCNPDPADRLHLRESPDRSSTSLGKYYNGTPVHVLKTEDEWVKVEILGRQGWMMKKYLFFGGKNHPLSCDTAAMPQLQLKGTELRVYTEPVRNSMHRVFGMMPGYHAIDDMRIIGILGNEWYHVWFPLTEDGGYVRQSDLWPGNG